MIHNYRWRLGLAEGEPKYDDLEKRLAEFPVIAVPTITLEGDANGAPHPDPSAYAKKFSGKYEHRTIEGGTGHNLPQEAPQAFAQAVDRRGRILTAIGTSYGSWHSRRQCRHLHNTSRHLDLLSCFRRDDWVDGVPVEVTVQERHGRRTEADGNPVVGIHQADRDRQVG